jgi:hypothetical protein
MGGWEMNLTWRRQPFLWELNLLNNLLALMEGVALGDEEDKWVWIPEEDGLFSVNSTYAILEDLFLLEEDVGDINDGVFSSLWRSPAPSKVVAFSWTLLLDRIPTRDNLALRHILDPGASLLCALCGKKVETSIHLFLHCEVSSLIWRRILDWLGINFITPHNLLVQFECWNYEVVSRRLGKGFLLERKKCKDFQ